MGKFVAQTQKMSKSGWYHLPADSRRKNYGEKIFMTLILRVKLQGYHHSKKKKQGQPVHMLQLFGIYIPLARLYIYILGYSGGQKLGSRTVLNEPN